jgi:hypothetical protein
MSERPGLEDMRAFGVSSLLQESNAGIFTLLKYILMTFASGTCLIKLLVKLLIFFALSRHKEFGGSGWNFFHCELFNCGNEEASC